MRSSVLVFVQVACGAAVAGDVFAQVAQPLPTVPVTASTELVRSAKLREFDRRRSNGIGRYLTEADLEKDQYRKLGDVLRKLPGIVMVRKRVPGGSPLAEFAVSARGVGTIEHVSPIFGKNCPIAIWIDGVPVYRGLDRTGPSPAFGGQSAPSPPGQVSEPPFDINSIMTQHVAAIEFYAGPATMPPELNSTQGTCGALVIWTK
ncbi:MAG TPA: TonB-dependent receptor plug domain-containing protein [Gemmatimonadaceae bacterium]